MGIFLRLGCTAFGGAIAGANAAVVGLLAAALYDPIFTSSIKDRLSLAIAVLAFAGLVQWRLPVLLVVLLTAGTRLARALLGV